MHTITVRVNGEECHGQFAETPEDLRPFVEWVDDMARRGERIAVDSETTSLDTFVPGFRLRLVQFGTATDGWLIPAEFGTPFANAVRYALRKLPRMTAQNFPFDGLVFGEHLGVPIEETFRRVVDTKILAHLADSRPEHEGGTGLSLKPLARHYVDPAATDGQTELIKEFHKIGKTKDTGWAHIDIRNPVYLRYALLDVLYGSRVLVALQDECRKRGIPARLAEYEHRIALIGAIIERKGMLIDQPYTERLTVELREEAARYAEVAKRYGVNSVNAPKQVAAALAGMGEVWTEKTDGGDPATGKEVLLPMADLDKDWQRIGARTPNPLADAVLRSKRAGKWATSYTTAMLDKVDASGRIHPHTSTMGARTARWAVSSPPLQQLPSSDWRVRRCVTAGSGRRIVASDFSQVELRVLAAMAGAQNVCDRINAGEDLHNVTTRLVFGIGPEVTDKELKGDKRRKLCKTISLGKAYAGGVDTLSKQTGLPSEQVKRALAQYDAALPEFKRYGKRLTRDAYANRMTVETPSGRVLRLNRDKVYTAIAFMCQSTARDILGQALIEMDDAGLLPHIIGVVHDEVIADPYAEDAEDVARALGERMDMPFRGVRIESDPEVYGHTWGAGYMKPEDKPLYDAPLEVAA
ncbi:DNA polymerase-1 [Actinomadura coerulea]|uniref:DNA polymerase I n=1 Tax=Actinomadura coerulea TaxID=46159 RepID=A0A7X0G6W8_9ACTN|nr:DNA polymerase [Actinomadura coerulea]MBB6400536.1 DNA polymerase-1 [Actinomadura coerulea]GGQ07936.1 hypothetical protein GCM10010187_25040 [Actinomadura coerulea]